MRFTKFGKTLLIGALSAGVVFGVTSCVESYTVGFLYVTGTVTAQSGNNGIISGYKIDHNTGKLAPIDGLPVPSGGSNPVRAVLVTGSRFVYVLNRGVNKEGNGDCTPSDPCLDSNITQFAVGGNGVLTYQETFSTEGANPFRLIGDSSGNYLMALDHDAPSSAACQAALGKSVTTCGDVTVFQINSTTGRLSVVQNAAVTQANCTLGALFPCPLTYFPVPANPVDFVLSGSSYLLTLSGSTAPTSYPYTGGNSIWPYSYASSSGQLTLSSNSSQPLGINEGTAIVNANSNIYVLDNEPITIPACTTSTCAYTGGTYPSQMLPFSVGSGGSLSALTGGIIPDASTLSNPIYLLITSKNYMYVANQGNNVTGTNNPESGIAAYYITTQQGYQTQFVLGQPYGSGSGPQCIVEDPSSQFIYEANEYDSSITGRVLDPNSGQLDGMRVTSTYTLQGPATWCFVDGRTG
ncbi:MAG: beta-propeller fold lactonase family protein [Terracidiphilus sp.]|jgi:6-phosphogluconolactonase (cycloisomerase 2 family)